MELSDAEFSLPKPIHAIWTVGMLNRCAHTGIQSREHCIIQGRQKGQYLQQEYLL